MDTEWDVVVIGGGPSGATAAYYLAASGRSVLVCEKKSFPRDKPCGDGLTPRAIAVLDDMGLGPAMADWPRVKGLRLHAPGKVVEAPFPQLDSWCDYGLVKSRDEFDTLLLDHAAAAGAEVRYKTEVVDAARDDERVTGVVVRRPGAADADTETIRARWVVCAEGAARSFARAVGRQQRDDYPLGLALRQYFPASVGATDWFETYFDLRLAPGLLPGYGWVFPQPDGSMNVGVGIIQTSKRWASANLHEVQALLLDQLAERWDIDADTERTKTRGGRLFMGGSMWPAHGPGYVLVGDAAGMVSPFTGEGIAYGMETARMAARHLDAALDATTPPSLAAYSAELESTFGASYRLGRLAARMMGDPRLMRVLLAFITGSQRRTDFTLRLVLDLDDPGARTSEQRGLTAVKRLAGIGS